MFGVLDCRLRMTDHATLSGPGEGRRGITLKQVAEEAGVSRATVSLVLRGSPLVADATRKRVQDAMLEVGYVYNRGAARLRTGSSGTIGMIVPEITNPFYAELTAGVDEVFDSEGRLAFLANSNDRPERQARFINRIREQGVDGIILCAATGTSPSLADELRSWGTPFVEILRSIADVPSDFVAPDFRKGTELAVDYLVATGHSRLALIASASANSATHERIDAFGAAMQQHGLSSAKLLRCATDGTAASACLGVLLALPSPPTAVVCHNDQIALALLRAVRERGLVPGRDLRIVGFDNIPGTLNSVPELTTVATAPFAVGVAAARLLLRRIAGDAGPPERILIEPTLRVRGT